MADVKVKHKKTGRIMDMSEYAYELESHEWELMGLSANPVNKPIVVSAPVPPPPTEIDPPKIEEVKETKAKKGSKRNTGN